MKVTKEAVRRLMITKQGINEFPTSAQKKDIYNTIDSLGCLQIDTISVIERAHYLTLWSRLGSYNKEYLHTLTYKDRKLFEYQAHATCFIPYKDYKYYIQSMEERKTEIESRFKKRMSDDTTIIDTTLQRIKDEGPLSSKDFEGPKRKGGWWNWKPAKYALELLFNAGILQIHHRTNFQRYYDLTENILPPEIDTTPPTEQERNQFFIEKTMQCLGPVQPIDLRKYYHHSSVRLNRTTRQLQVDMEKQTNEGAVTKFQVDDDPKPLYGLPEDATRLETITSDFDFENVRLLSYFDNLLWNRQRVQQLFEFESKLEIYVPKPRRVYGYYHLPVLYGDRIVARLEPKMDRKENKLIVRGYWLEQGFQPTEDYENKLAANLEKFATFHGTNEIEWLIEA